MLKLNIKNETSRLRAVVLGIAKNNGPVPKVQDCYDPKSIQHVVAGTYPKEEDMDIEMEAVASILEKYNVEVFRLPGWIAQWKEMRLNKEPIGRPRQIYTGENLRPFKSIEKR